jgi:NAD(P)-dependent dehydrogenase (short-subunit alcohol dehydrogenase family)
MEQLEGKVAVVIGGGGGVGSGMCHGLAEAGMHVVVADIELDSARRTADALVSGGGSAIAHHVDATSRDSLAALADAALARFGAVHLLGNNVGVILGHSIEAATDTDWAWIVEFNIMSIVRGVDVFLPHLRAHGEQAHIVTTSSMGGLLALPPAATGGVNTGLYTTTKHALMGYSAMLRADLEPEGIGVSVLCPGLVEGNLSETAARNRPARHGGPTPTPDRETQPPGAMPSEQIGAGIVAGVRANRLHLFTHTDGYIADMMRARFDALMDDFTDAARQAT